MRAADWCGARVGVDSRLGGAVRTVSFECEDPPDVDGVAPDVDDDRVAGRYELREELGQGATARVWQAWDTLLHRMVALKVLDGRHANAAGLQRVLGEARATSDVVSDYVVRVQGVSGADAEVPYIDMELCAEFTATGERLLARPMSEVRPKNLREAIRWAIHASRGVHAAHQQNVFHRDLKPENILIRPASRRAQVTDFGLGVELAALGEEARAASSTVAIRQQRKCIAGTPMYMAPEAARGLEPADPADPEQRQVLVALDVYGLGAVLYELLANRPPYQPTPGADDPLRDVLAQVRAHPPPSLRSWRMWLKRDALRVPARLARVVDKAMARDPAERYHRMRDAADASGLLHEWDAHALSHGVFR